MSFVNSDHEEFRSAVRRFTDEEIIPIASELDAKNAEIPMEIIAKMAEQGYFGVLFPEEYDGLGLDNITMTIVAEELSRGWLSVGSVMTRGVIMGTLLQAHGTDEQKKKYLPGLAMGEVLPAAAFTEPDSGSDSASMIMKATKTDGGYLLNGAKAWCTYANRANVLMVLARTNPDTSLRHKGLSMFFVEKESAEKIVHPNIQGEPIPTVGYHGMRSYNLAFEDVFVPDEGLLGGEENKGFYQLMVSYESARLQTAARAVGVATAAFDFALQYSKEREQFGKPICEHQAIRMKLSEMKVELEAARQLTYYAASLKDSGKRCDLEAGMAKVKAAKAVEFITREAMQILGGYGYSKEFPVERYWRDGRVISIFEGTSEIQHEVIAKAILK
ncbi:acyl-CoA dehydrogenase [bacterium]|jgi:alkylation response protein AidB-like acyl-CoA dehydrogenase|nr:acyl-CoA dehydrogenase [bacterium]MBT3850749.1 acyl-CoA dehydrogenase [bacterium]MBT4435103.1 acyl-CoA dehydrogenase [bacterium]MDG2445429.1 acyl-CoA dehydrogenase family protein [Thermodesulfobacteriota bacterium]|tara:strand:+ start:2049 stop:3209 length:1161 start_codon:yes stop_codon:yes gene_type:complete